MKNSNNHRTSPTLHVTAFLLVAAFITALIVSIILRVEIVARGIGKIVPSGQVKVVQAEFGGKIQRILVKDGDQVEFGQRLINFDATDAKGRHTILQSEINQLKIERIRVETLAAALSNAIPENNYFQTRLHKDYSIEISKLRKTHPLNEAEERFQEEQVEQLEADAAAIVAKLRQITSRKITAQKSIAVTQADIARLSAALDIQRQRLEAAKKLLKRKVSSKSIYLDVFDQYSRLEKEQERYVKEIEQKNAQLHTYSAETDEAVTSLRSSQLARRTAVDLRLSLIKPQLTLAKRELNSSVVIAPVSGVITGLSVHTVGGVVNKSDELMKIVPNSAAPVIEVVFTNADVGFLKPGQIANIKLDAFPSERFGYVQGLVDIVAADATEVTDDVWGFIAQIKPQGRYLNAPTGKFLLKPGMTAVVDVVTGERRLISYFFAPIVETIQGSLGER